MAGWRDGGMAGRLLSDGAWPKRRESGGVAAVNIRVPIKTPLRWAVRGKASSCTGGLRRALRAAELVHTHSLAGT